MKKGGGENMGKKVSIAVSIEHSLEHILGYKIYDKIRAVEDGICANYFDVSDDSSDLKKALIKAIDVLNFTKEEKDSLKDTVNAIENNPFEQTAELWQVIFELLEINKKLTETKKT